MGMAIPAVPYPAGGGQDPLSALMARVGTGEEAALAELYDATSHRVYGLAFRVLRVREDAEEVTLDVYTQVWRGRTPYDPGRGSVLKFLLMLARTRAVDLLRSRARRSQIEERVEELSELPEAGTSNLSFGDAFAARRLQLALATLPDGQRVAIEAAYFQGLSHSEVATALGQPLGTIKTRIRDGLLALRRAMALPEEGIA
jgi:RNA polymerase sigma-70 factor (ECF subfamily)